VIRLRLKTYLFTTVTQILSAIADFVPVRLSLQSSGRCIISFYAPQLYRQVLLRHVLAMGILSVCLSDCLSVCLSRPGGIPSPD